MKGQKVNLIADEAGFNILTPEAKGLPKMQIYQVY